MDAAYRYHRIITKPWHLGRCRCGCEECDPDQCHVSDAELYQLGSCIL